MGRISQFFLLVALLASIGHICGSQVQKGTSKSVEEEKAEGKG
jgi:hypothetical protein